jgi:hypothetical protein
MLRFALLITVVTFFACNNKTAEVEKATRPGQPYIDSMRTTTIDLTKESDEYKLLCQQWEHEEDALDARAAGDGGSDAFEMVFRGFAFFSDGTVLQNPRGQMHIGKWSYDATGRMITVEPNGGSAEKYKINALAANKLVITKVSVEGATKQVYKGQAYTHKNIKDDPFYPANNTWRIKPVKAETDEAVTARTKQYIGFYYKFYNDALIRDSSIISFYGFPACFNWYSGGIGIIEAKKLKNDWVNCFYNKAQALQAQALLEKAIVKKYKWTKGLPWTLQTTLVLRQMYDQF